MCFWQGERDRGGSEEGGGHSRRRCREEDETCKVMGERRSVSVAWGGTAASERWPWPPLSNPGHASGIREQLNSEYFMFSVSRFLKM